MSQLPEGYLSEIRDVLAHFYDYAHLVDHPLVGRLQALLGCEGTLAVQKLRRLLLQVMEELRPLPDTPSADAAWRPYAVLQHRFVLGQELAEVERELGLGRRQVQREQQRAVLALAIALYDRQKAAMETQPANDALWQEITRVAAERQVFQAGEQFERAMAPARALAQQQGVTLVEQRTSAPLPVSGDPALFRQLLVATASFALRLETSTSLTVCLERRPGEVVCTFSAAPGPATPPEYAMAHRPCKLRDDVSERHQQIPEAVVALARAQGACIEQGTGETGWQLVLALPAAERARTIAMVDDNPDVVALFRRYLSSHGYTLIGIPDGAQALERIAEARPDVVVLDVMMRGVDGWEVLQRLKADPGLRAIPVLICSVLDEPQLATSLGAQGYLRKPVRPAQLLERLAEIVGSPSAPP